MPPKGTKRKTPVEPAASKASGSTTEDSAKAKKVDADTPAEKDGKKKVFKYSNEDTVSIALPVVSRMRSHQLCNVTKC
jgi:hypothetical protein